MKNVLLFMWGCTHICRIFSQDTGAPVNAHALSLAAYSKAQVDVFSFHSNQAALAEIKNFTAGMFTERKFMLKELAVYKVCAALPTHSGNFGLEMNRFGFADFTKTQIGLAYARQLGGKCNVGIQFNYHSLHAPGYGNASTVDFEAGAIFHLTEQLHAGIHVCNPVGGKFGKNEAEKLPSVYSGGMGYDVSKDVLIAIEIEKEDEQPVNVHAGVEYEFLNRVFAKLGISSATSSLYMGMGVGWRSVRIEIVSSYHQQLGYTPALLLQFNQSKDDK